MKNWAWIICAVALCGAAGGVRADGVADGKAGLEALDKGDYDAAIRLFTRALLLGKLSRDDSEFAYLNRGSAYAGKGDLDHAIADYHKALNLKPDDGDAQAALQSALDKKAAPARADNSPMPAGVPGDPWGLLSAMAGKFYWYQALGKPPHDAYLKVVWVAEPRDLSITVRNKTAQQLVSEYKIDNTTGKIIFSALVNEAPEYGTVDINRSGFTETTFVAGQAVRFVTRPQADGSLLQTKQVFLGGSWKDTTSVQLVETNPDELAEAGLMKAKKKRKDAAAAAQ